MPLKQKAGYIQHTTPTTTQNDGVLNKSSVVLDKTQSVLNKTFSPALEYWKTELASKDPATTDLYFRSFDKFLQFTGKTADELLTQRQQEQTNPDRKIQRRMESQLNAFISKKRQDGLASATLQVYFASVRSFFEIHYYPLIMRKGDYPKGESLGVRVAPKEAILKAIENKQNRNKKQLRALILFLKDSGLRRSDTVLLNFGKVAEGLEKGYNIISITLVTEKQHTVAKAFIGEEAIQALKEYLKERRTGTENVPPEIITDKSPLFRTQESGKVKRLSLSGFSNMIREAFLRVGESNLSPHSLRKYVQTYLEAGNVNVNWIDQILGYALINSRDAYSKPTDEQLKEAYNKAYDHLRIYPKPIAEHIQPLPPISQQATTETQTADVIEVKANDIQAIKQALLRGYRHTDTVGDIRLYLRS